MWTSYHTHTLWSDGTSSLAALCDAARAAGLDELGISDHYVCPDDGRAICWSMAPEALAAYVAAVLTAREEVGTLTLRLGLEVDYFPETVDTLRVRFAAYPFDYLIGSVHLLNDFPIDEDRQHWDALDPDARVAQWRAYYRQLIRLADSGLCDIVGHLDLPKKFGLLPTADLAVEVAAALDAISAANLTLELNTAGWDKDVQEAYPSLEVLRQARRRDIPLVITADAHAPAELTRHYPRAYALAHDAGYTHLVRFHGREREAVRM